MPWQWAARLAAAIGVALCLGGAVAAEEVPTLTTAPQQVDGPTISSLIRTTLIALHQANITGNYTVLRDLGARILQASNTDADLAARFAGFRQNRISLSPVVLLDAVLDDKPRLSTDGQLRLVGHFQTKPQEIIFDMTFLYEGDAWRIAILNVGTRLPTGTDDDAATTAPKSAGLKPVPTPRVRPKS